MREFHALCVRITPLMEAAEQQMPIFSAGTFYALPKATPELLTLRWAVQRFRRAQAGCYDYRASSGHSAGR